MNSFSLILYWLRAGTSIGFTWYVVVFLMAGLVTVTKSVGHEIQNLEGQESEPQSLSYHYEPHNRREPFLPLVIPEFQKLSSSSSIERSPTHKPTWKLLGIISGRQGYYASIQNSEGKRYIVTPGSVIPSDGLKVKRIGKTELEFDYLDERKVTTNLERSPRLIVSF